MGVPAVPEKTVRASTQHGIGLVSVTRSVLRPESSQPTEWRGRSMVKMHPMPGLS